MSRKRSKAIQKLLVSPIVFNTMSSNRSGSFGGSRSGDKPPKPQKSVQQIIKSLSTHRINTLTELCRVERTAATCDNEIDARAFQEPMTAAWTYYVTSHQFLSELRGLTRSYPFSGDMIHEAHERVRADPQSNCSWNLAWLCLRKMRDDGLVATFAAVEAARPEMWGNAEPSAGDLDQLAACFEHAWSTAIDRMLRHWTFAPTWY